MKISLSVRMSYMLLEKIVKIIMTEQYIEIN